MNGMPVSDIVPELVLLIGAVLILVFALSTPRRLQRYAAILTLVVLVAAAIATVWLYRTGPQRFTFAQTYAVDGVAIWAKLIILGATALVTALSVEWFGGDARQGEYYTLLLMSALGAVLMAGASDLMELLLAVLLSSATGSVITAYHRQSRRAGEAAIKYYLLGALSNGLMVYGVVLLFGLAATTTYAPLLARLGSAHPVPLIAGAGLMIVGLAFKVGAVPVHAWMPDVADGAPAPVAAFITTVSKIGALIALARLMLILPDATSGWRPVIAAIAALTMTLGNAAALWQDNVRRMLGWSAVSQTGYALMAIVAIGRSPLALPSLLYFLVAYTLGNMTAFGVVIHLRGLSRRERYTGLARSHPVLSGALAISLLSFVGIPPLAGFAAKLTLFGAAIDAGYGWLAVLATINTVVSLAYYARLLGPMYFGNAAPAEGEGEGEGEPLYTLGGWSGSAAILSAAAVIVGGIAAEPLLAAFHVAQLLPAP